MPTSAIGALVEGTVGRTKIGKKLGLNDVNIPSVPVGAFAAGQTGVGAGGTKGFKETKEESAKRVETRERTVDEEYRKAKSKKVITDGMAAEVVPPATRTAAQEDAITEMQKAIKDMSNKEIAALDHNTLASKKVAEALTAGHLKAINDSEKSETEKRQIFELHFAKTYEAAEALRTGTNPATGAPLTDTERAANQNVIRNISDKELDYIPTSIFDPNKLESTTPAGATPEGERSRAFLKTITQSQVDNLIKGDKLIASEKQAVKDARNRPLQDAFDHSDWPVAINIMREMRPETLVQLDDAKLTETEVLNVYRTALLNKMAARSELTDSKANAIRTAIINAVNHPPAGFTPSPDLIETKTWLEGDGLKIF